MNILVTGAAGFVGSNLVRALADGGQDQVVGVTRRATGFTSPGYREIELDLAGADFAARLPSSADVVIHLAQSLGYRNFPATANDLFAVNVESTFQLLEWSRTHGVKRFCFASTGNVYRPSAGELRETDPCEPASFYGASKLAAETLVSQYASFFGTTILRIFGVYGPGQRNMLIPDMIQRIRSGTEITLAEDRGVVLTQAYIDDCVEWLRRLVGSEQGVACGVFNLGGDEAVDLKTIATILGQKLGLQPKMRATDGKASYFVGDSSRLYAQTGYRPRIRMAEGLGLTVLASASAP